MGRHSMPHTPAPAPGRHRRVVVRRSALARAGAPTLAAVLLAGFPLAPALAADGAPPPPLDDAGTALGGVLGTGGGSTGLPAARSGTAGSGGDEGAGAEHAGEKASDEPSEEASDERVSEEPVSADAPSPEEPAGDSAAGDGAAVEPTPDPDVDAGADAGAGPTAPGTTVADPATGAGMSGPGALPELPGAGGLPGAEGLPELPAVAGAADLIDVTGLSDPLAPPGAQDGSTVVTLAERNDSGISGEALVDAEQVVGTVSGMDPGARYVSFFYGATSSATNNNPCILDGTNPLPGDQTIGEWEVDADGNGTLRADNPLGARYPLQAGTMSIRKVEHDFSTATALPVNPLSYSLVACGEVERLEVLDPVTTSVPTLPKFPSVPPLS
jgi:hypothetical protein